ncbi:MAG: glycoside hydrolase family 2 protein [Terriglobia bacterium]
MIGRRQFIFAAGASSVVPLLAPALSESAVVVGAKAGGRLRIDLAGYWDRFYAGAFYDRIPVPSSQRPLGFYTLRRDCVLPALSGGQRVILHFDAITYYGQASVNGAELGTMEPYLPYEFDFTSSAREGGNRVEVAIVDLASGPNGEGKDEVILGANLGGWEAYGGIIRDVYAEIRPAIFTDNVRFGYTLSENYGHANCRATVFVSSREAAVAKVRVNLEHGPSVLAHAKKSVHVTPGITEVELDFDLSAPALWSPEIPNLYDLKVTVEGDQGVDDWSTRTGFRQVGVKGSQFFLNGQPLVLKGVNRHDMWKGEGFTLTAAQMEQDMRMIKEFGCNFVRLAHYPHHRRILELADEIGLLVSEEPGPWGINFPTAPQSIIDLVYRILEGEIRRDWNSPSVFAWLLGDSGLLGTMVTVEYLKEGKARCRKLDPVTRLVSWSNDIPMEQAKPIFEEAGMDFFDLHIYAFDPDVFRRTAEFFGPGKPFTSVEWGAMVEGQSRPVMEHTVDTLIELSQAKQMAGYVYWEWADMMQFTREGWMMHNGVLNEGVVTQSREPREEVYMELARLFEGRLDRIEREPKRPTVVPLTRPAATPGNRFSPIDLQSLVEGTDARRSWAAFEQMMAKYWTVTGPHNARDQWQKTGEKFQLWQVPEVTIAGIPFRTPIVNGHIRPLILTPETPAITIPLNLACVRLQILGQVTFPEGFPIVGRQGEQIAAYRLQYADGKQQEVPVRNGFEAAQANVIYMGGRINPVAAHASRALLFIKDEAREHYQVLLWPLSTEKKRIENIGCKLIGQQPALAIFAITAESAE